MKKGKDSKKWMLVDEPESCEIRRKKTSSELRK